ncbi:hypothetical protein BAUCODRAFT_39889 [Baudoinia panamericana UAMH 10762]|uniref:Uncharacterized protein n=1 Tax=Baudoinia panamericana (strain UAMH 10762) TaxID=717646 RepID=M2MWC4_BAUPA|nr:uncharacterized protein BAUCODRAFT_39889 [Baudoinia panamericana UAMH 10762]EMC90884.1 hypothetical protein BAUCODRAFT_39889 [Baudoinia panamericana UAMH 10762]
MASRTVPVARPEDLTTTRTEKLVRHPHFLEPTDEMISEGQNEPHAATLKKWDTYNALGEYIRDHGKGVNYNVELGDGGFMEVGTLRGTSRTVYSFFEVHENGRPTTLGDVSTWANGSLQVTLVAGPFDHEDYFHAEVPSEAEMTDQHGTVGFIACGKVLDWNAVEFDAAYAMPTLTQSYAKIVKALTKKLEL